MAGTTSNPDEAGRWGKHQADPETGRLAQRSLDRLEEVALAMIAGREWGQTRLTLVWEGGKITFAEVENRTTEKRTT